MRTVFTILPCLFALISSLLPANATNEPLQIRTVKNNVIEDPYGDHFPFRKHLTDSYEKSLGPQDADVDFVINNRPVSYSQNTYVDYVAMQKQLKQALETAQQNSTVNAPVIVLTRPIRDIDGVKMVIARAANPNLSVTIDDAFVRILYQPQKAYQVEPGKVEDVMIALATLNCKTKEYPESERWLQQAIALREKRLGKDSPEVARFADYLAIVYRECGDYDMAEKTLLQSLSIKQRSLSPSDPSLAASYMNLADLYYDRDPSYLAKATKFRKKAEAMAVDAGSEAPALPVPSQFSCGVFSNWKSFADTATLIESGNRDFHASNDAEIASIKALIKSLFPDESGSYIWGTAKVPLDRSHSLVYRNVIADPPPEISQDIGKFKLVANPGQKKVSDLKDIPVVLCSAELIPAFDQVIKAYAKKYGFSMDDYGKTWPGIHDQAVEILDAVTPTVGGFSRSETTTNDLGEFEFKGVPKINKKVPKEAYCLFCYIVTSKSARYWLIPLDIDGKSAISRNISSDNAHVLWEENRVMPTEVAAVRAQPKGGNGTALVPPPAPALYVATPPSPSEVISKVSR